MGFEKIHVVCGWVGLCFRCEFGREKGGSRGKRLGLLDECTS